MAGTGVRRRLLVIGLDGVPPEFLFDRMRPVMPTTARLLDRSLRAPLRTTDPPLSIPAWPVMFSGVDPGTLGFYGFRHRKDHSYTETYVPTSTQMPVPSVWQTVSSAGRRVAVIGMPMGYPPPIVNGLFVSDFLTPPGSRPFTSPPELGGELEAKYGPYPFDVVFRSNERERLLGEILRMTETRFRIAADLVAREPWDLFGVHEIGSDRLNHAYWKCFDDRHPDFVPGNPHAGAARKFYEVLDRGIAGLLAAAGPEAAVLIVSDHGSMAMRGCFCINQWLAEKGYLVLRSPPAPGTPLEKADVDWDRTTVWGSGGYYARIFFNIRGREARGIVALDQVPALRRHLEDDLQRIPAPDGEMLDVDLLDPASLYHEVRGDAPDLMLYFGDLKWRSAGTMGYPSLFLRENDTGPDDAVHSWNGVFVWYDPEREGPAGELPTQQIRDVAPTILEYLGVPLPAHLQGRPIVRS
ncbi:MAG: alkaline phosphatase family protein [Thermoplasmata archaeon]